MIQGHCQGAPVCTALASIQPHMYTQMGTCGCALLATGLSVHNPSFLPASVLEPWSRVGSSDSHGLPCPPPKGTHMAQARGYTQHRSISPGPAILSQTHRASAPSRQRSQTTQVVPPRDNAICHKGPFSWITEPLLVRNWGSVQSVGPETNHVTILLGEPGAVPLSEPPSLCHGEAAAPSSISSGADAPPGTGGWLRPCRAAQPARWTGIPRIIC